VTRRATTVAALTAAAIGVLATAGAALARTPPALDTTPPAVAAPVVSLDESSRTVTVTAPAVDQPSGSPIGLRYVWTAGDGTPPQTMSSQFIHRYRALGTYAGTVTVLDPAGNSATQSFTVAVVDHIAPRLGYMLVEPGVLATHNLRVVLAPTERTSATIGASIRVAGRTYRLTAARRQLFPGRFTGVRMAVRREAREAIARALRRGLSVRARVRVVFIDEAGNGATATGATRVTG
jgi:hypothetical protein